MLFSAPPLKEVLGNIKDDNLRIPTFVRTFIWKPSKIIEFFDAIFKGSPIGCITIFKTGSVSVVTQSLKDAIQRNSNLYVNHYVHDALPIETTFEVTSYNVRRNFLLDGMQRISALYLMLQDKGDYFKTQNALNSDNWQSFLWFDLEEQTFHFLQPNQLIPDHFFPMNHLFNNVSTLGYIGRVKEKWLPNVDRYSGILAGLFDLFSNLHIPTIQLNCSFQEASQFRKNLNPYQ
jgi:hypothetical protein